MNWGKDKYLIKKLEIPIGDKYELEQGQISHQEMVHCESLLLEFSFFLALAERWRSFTSSSSFFTSSSWAESLSCRRQS